MTIDEAIKHAEEVMVENLGKTKGRNASDPIAINCSECAEEHRQLAEWLKELKRYRERNSTEAERGNRKIIVADIVEKVYGKAKEKAKPFGYVRYDGRTYQAELPILKTEHKDGECSFAGFWEVKA